ncbi:MAG: M28 family peptidase [Bacteroidales bacterium]|nr:M28 family peptidase [Bacteroidales bacterium]
MTKKSKKIKILVLTIAMAGIYGGIAAGQDTPAADNSGNPGGIINMHDGRAAQNIVWESKLRRNVEFLADSLCNGRATGTRGGCEAAFSVIRTFRKAGLVPFDRSYSMSFYTADSLRCGHNIIGMIPGSRKNPVDSYIIIGAHYDHLGCLNGYLYPGADNNASGVAALTAIAEMFSSMKTLGKVYNASIIFVAFDAKELSMAGSEDLWKRIEEKRLADPLSGRPITREKIKLMANIDQIGSSLSPLGSGREDFMIVLGRHTLTRDDSEWLPICNKFYGTSLELSDSYYGSENFTRLFYTLSDQKVFASHKIPALLFTSGITMNTNKTYDSPESLNYPVLRRRILLIYHWIEKMAMY